MSSKIKIGEAKGVTVENCVFTTEDSHPCDLCGSTDFTVLRQGAVVCSRCGFVYVPNRRSPAEIAKAWDDIWGPESYTSAWPAVKARLTYVAEHLDQTIGLPGKTLLDIGAGEGTFLEYANLLGATCLGLEPDPKNCQKIGDAGLSYFQGTIEDFQPDRQFDIVTLNWTLENTGDCIGVLKKARSLLEDGGHICVATGSRILVPFKKPFSSYFSDNPPDLHCFRFSVDTLHNAFALLNMSASFNDFMSNDWLVAVAKNCDVGSVPLAGSNPNEVLGFFDAWEKQWP